MAVLPLQLARVSNLLRTQVGASAISRTQQHLLKVQNELSTGQRINVPSDDAGDAAVVQQLQKLLEQREAYADNLKHAQNHLSTVDSTLGELSDLLDEAQTITSANVGSDVTAGQRASAAAVIKSIYSQVLSLANKQSEGVFLFAGDKSTDAPFIEIIGGVRFAGSSNLLQNAYDENAKLPFMVDGAQVFGALSSRVQGSVDLSPSLALTTRLSDIAGATQAGVTKGSIQISNGSTSAIIDLSAADAVGDVINSINNAGVGSITASIAPDGNSIQLGAGGGDNITATEIGGGATAAQLGILQTTAQGAGVAVDGGNVGPLVTDLTPLSALRGGLGIDTSGLIITNGQSTSTIDLSTATTVEDLLNAVNGSSSGVLARINAAGTGVDLVNPTQGVTMTIGENGGTTAADLGIRSLSPTTPLTQLNGGKGVNVVAGPELQIARKDGTSFQVEITGATTIQDVINAINAADAGGGVTASFAAIGNGIVLADSTGGAGPLSAASINFSTAARDLGLEQSAPGTTINGGDTNGVEIPGVFGHLQKLQSALAASDTAGITAAAEGLKQDYDRIVRVRGETGARVQELEARSNRLQDENLATRRFLSDLKDTDFADAISRFQTLQTALQATLQTTASVLNLSLLDYL